MPFACRRIFAVLMAFHLFGGNASAAGPARYNLDPVHTRVMFAIDHAGFSKAIGTVSGSTGSLTFDPEQWQGATLQATVPLTRIDLGDSDCNKAAPPRNLLDATTYPTAEFVSSRVEPVAPDRASVHGKLTLHGVTREIVLDVKLNTVKRHPLPPFRRTVGFSATALLSRKDFGIDAWPSVIGDAVELRIEAEATRSRVDEKEEEEEEEADATDSPEDDSSSPDAAPAEAPTAITTEPTP